MPTVAWNRLNRTGQVSGITSTPEGHALQTLREHSAEAEWLFVESLRNGGTGERGHAEQLCGTVLGHAKLLRVARFVVRTYPPDERSVPLRWFLSQNGNASDAAFLAKLSTKITRGALVVSHPTRSCTRRRSAGYAAGAFAQPVEILIVQFARAGLVRFRNGQKSSPVSSRLTGNPPGSMHSPPIGAIFQCDGVSDPTHSAPQCPNPPKPSS